MCIFVVGRRALNDRICRQQRPYMSEEDRRGEEILKSSIKVVEDHFEVALKWAEEQPEIPANYPLAFKTMENHRWSL